MASPSILDVPVGTHLAIHYIQPLYGDEEAIDTCRDLRICQREIPRFYLSSDSPGADFAILEDQFDNLHGKVKDNAVPNRTHDRNKDNEMASMLSTIICRTSWFVIVLCFISYVGGLLLYSTALYQDVIQKWILSNLNCYLHTNQNWDGIASLAFLLGCGFFSAFVASMLWFALQRSVLRYRSYRFEWLSQLLHRKPALCIPSNISLMGGTCDIEWKIVYINATWSEIMLMIFVLSGNIFVFVNQLAREVQTASSSKSGSLRKIGNGFGYSSLFSLVWLFLPVTKQNSIWMDILHLPYPFALKYHQWLGKLVVTLALLHGLCHAVAFGLKGEFTAQMMPHFRSMFDDFPLHDLNGVNTFGQVALAMMLLILLMSLSAIRRKCYTLFKAIHQLLTAAIVFGVCIHFPPALWWLLPPFLNLLTEKVIAIGHAQFPVEIIDMSPLSNGITRMVFRRGLGRCESGGQFSPGQFVYLRVPYISWLQWHPFYITSSPTRHPASFTCYARAIGHWTEAVHDLAKFAYATKEAPVIHIDGFYGPSNQTFYTQYHCLVLMASGIGVTAMLSILEELYIQVLEQVDQTTLELPTDAINGKVIWFLWTSRDWCLLTEFEDLLLRIRVLDPHERYFKLRLYFSKSLTTEELGFIRREPCVFQSSVRPAQQHSYHLNDEQYEVPFASVPQNRGGCCGWFTSRPFQKSITRHISKIAVQFIVLLTAVVVAIHFEWNDKSSYEDKGTGVSRSSEEAMFRPMQHLKEAICVLIACFSAFFVVFVEEWIRTCKQRSYKTFINHDNFLRKAFDAQIDGFALRSRNKRHENRANSAIMTPFCTPEEDWLSDGLSILQSLSIGSDIRERLNVFPIRPDLDKFIETIGQSFSSYAGTIGVFACGSNEFVHATEAAIISTEQDKRNSVKASFKFHRMNFQL